MKGVRTDSWKHTVAAVCALALTLVAFAHRPLEPDTRVSDPQLAAYLAMGGSLAALGLSGDAEEDDASHAECPACTFSKAMALFPACPAPLHGVGRSDDRVAWTERLILTGHGPHAPPARGPPTIRLI